MKRLILFMLPVMIITFSSVCVAQSESEKEYKMKNTYDFASFRNVKITGVKIEDLSEDEQAVLYLQARYCQAMTEPDLDTMRELIAEDATFTHMSGRTQTREEYFADVESGALRYYKIGIENPVIEIKNNRATLRYTSVLNANAYGARGTYRMNGLHPFEKVNGQWMKGNK